MLKIIENKIKDHIVNCSKVVVIDDRGDGHYIKLEVTSSSFKDLSSLQRHQMINNVIKEFIDSGEIHAVNIKTFIE